MATSEQDCDRDRNVHSRIIANRVDVVHRIALSRLDGDAHVGITCDIHRARPSRIDLRDATRRIACSSARLVDRARTADRTLPLHPFRMHRAAAMHTSRQGAHQRSHARRRTRSCARAPWRSVARRDSLGHVSTTRPRVCASIRRVARNHEAQEAARSAALMHEAYEHGRRSDSPDEVARGPVRAP